MPFGKDFFNWIRFAIMVLKILSEVFGDDGVADDAREIIAKMNKLSPDKMADFMKKTA